MGSAMHDLFGEIRKAQTIEQYRSALSSVAKDLGFDYFAFGVRMPFPLTTPEFRIVSNYPSEWTERYQSSGYVNVDPTVKHALQSLAPVIWSGPLTEENPDFWAEARAHGLRFGWAQPSRGIEGTLGMLTLARSSEQLGPNEVAQKLPMLSLMSVFCHEAFVEITKRSSPEQVVPKLTAREVEVLRWTAEGKFSIDISAILGIAERTVNFHISNSMKKLGATSKTSATVQAALWGLL